MQSKVFGETTILERSLTTLKSPGIVAQMILWKDSIPTAFTTNTIVVRLYHGQNLSAGRMTWVALASMM